MSEEVVLRPSGELDLAAVGPLRLGWYTLAVEVAPPVVVIDLAGVTFADAAFVGLVVGMRRRQAEHGGVVRLRHPAPIVLRLLRLTGICDLVEKASVPARPAAESSTFGCPRPPVTGRSSAASSRPPDPQRLQPASPRSTLPLDAAAGPGEPVATQLLGIEQARRQ